MKRIIFLGFIIAFTPLLLFAQNNPDSLKFNVGDIYYFNGDVYQHGGYTSEWDFIDEVIGDTLINGDRFFIFQRKGLSRAFEDVFPYEFSRDYSQFKFYLRIESGKIYSWENDSKKLIIDFSAKPNDQMDNYQLVIETKEAVSVFGDTLNAIKTVKGNNLLTTLYTKKFGVVEHSYGGSVMSGEVNLIAAIIGDELYGDTLAAQTLVSNEAQEEPNNFFLYQNYPNPFNPVTSIRFELDKPGEVKVLVLDVLGRKVQTLLSEKRAAGIHQVNFNAQRLSSGMYFYQILFEEHQMMRKMMLVK